MSDKEKLEQWLDEDGWSAPESEEFAKAQEALQKEMDDRMTNPSEIPKRNTEKKKFPQHQLGYHRKLGFVPRWYHAVLVGLVCVGLGSKALEKTGITYQKGEGVKINLEKDKNAPKMVVNGYESGEMSHIYVSIYNNSNKTIQIQQRGSEVQHNNGRTFVTGMDSGIVRRQEFSINAGENIELTLFIPHPVEKGNVVWLRTEQGGRAGRVEARLK